VILTITPDSTGKIPDEQLAALREEAAVGRSRVVIASHGLATTYVGSASFSDAFMAGVDVRRIELGVPEPDCLTMIINWPSACTEDDGSPLNVLSSLGFWKMEQRADLIGRTDGYQVLDTVLDHLPASGRIILIGHSFGTKVVCAALTMLEANWSLGPSADLRLFRLAPAFENTGLNSSGIYADLTHLPVQIWVNRSSLDRALSDWFPVARRAELKSSVALGYAGPDPVTVAQWGSRLTVFDMTAVHRANVGWNGGAGGSHDDQMHNENYDPIIAALA
jgi:hypothetical protein